MAKKSALGAAVVKQQKQINQLKKKNKKSNKNCKDKCNKKRDKAVAKAEQANRERSLPWRIVRFGRRNTLVITILVGVIVIGAFVALMNSSYGPKIPMPVIVGGILTFIAVFLIYIGYNARNHEGQS